MQVEHKKIIISFIVAATAILVLSLISPSKVGAQYYNQGEVKKSILIDKKIRNITENKFFDNIDATQKTFYEGDILEFSIKVENTGNETLTDIKSRDILPKYLDLIFYPGEYKKEENTIEWSIDKLDPGQNKSYLIRARVKNTSSLETKETVKLTNIAESSANDIFDKDNASYFVGGKSIPATGDNTLIIKTISITLVCASGLFLRKLARGY